MMGISGGATGNQWNLSDLAALVDYTVAQGVPVLNCEDLISLEAGSF
jgi:hypothetical protein